jgi:hypothetical protein
MDQTFQDTPLKTYIFGSVLSPLGALVAAGFVRREEPYLVRWLAAGLSAFLTYLAVTLLDFVGLL